MSLNAIQSTYGNVSNPRALLARWMGEVCIITLICISVTLPPVPVSSSMPLVKMEHLLLPVVFAMYAWLLLAGCARMIRLNGMFIIAPLMCFFTILSLWYGSSILGHTVILRDFYELPKEFLPAIFFTVAYEAELSEASLHRLLNYLAFAILLICLYAWAQFAHLGPTYAIDKYYSAGAHVDAGLERGQRVFSTMGNPNVLGQLMTWCLVAFILAAVLRVGSRVRNVALALACVVTLAMTGSRYGLLTSGLGIAMIFLMPSSPSVPRVKRMGLLLLFLPIFGWVVMTVAQSNQSIMMDRFQELQQPTQVGSLRTRLDILWRDAGNDIAQSPFVGHGPAKSIYTGIWTDSEYLDILKEFGAFGFLPYIAYFLFPLYLAWRGLRIGPFTGTLESAMPTTFLILRLSFIMGVTALVMNIGMVTFHNLSLQAFLWLWLGLGARSAKSIISTGGLSFAKT